MRPAFRLTAQACLLAAAAATSARAAAPLRVDARGVLASPPIEVRGGAAPTTSPLFVVEAPPVAASSYQISGTVEYDGVAGQGYLEMWSVFPDGRRFFSRTLAPSGPMAALSGQSGPRPFVLPFSLEPDPTVRPVRLEVNVVLPAGGRVRVSDVRFASPAEAGAPGAWWSSRQAGLAGGAAGAALGLIGALVGVLCSFGVARRLVEALLRTVLVAGLASLAAALAALARRQPYEVWYPLLLVGGLAAMLAPMTLRVARRRYDEAAPHPPERGPTR